MPLLTVATKSAPGFQLFSASCEIHKHQVKVLGMNDPRPMNHKVDGMGLKLILIRDFVDGHGHEFKPDDVFILTDSFDAVMADPWPVLEEKYRSFSADIVVSVETNCHPDPAMAPHFTALAPQSPTPYLNSGGIALTFSALQKLIHYKPFNAKTDDQFWMQQVFLDKNRPFSMALDYQNHLFQTLFGAFGHVYANLDGKWFNRLTQTNPSIIHGNGMPFQIMLNVFRMTFPLVNVNLAG